MLAWETGSAFHMNKYLQKIAAREGLKDAVNTGVIGATGAATSVLANKILHPTAPAGNWRKAALIGGGLGLLGDYAAVKLNKGINKHIDKL